MSGSERHMLNINIGNKQIGILGFDTQTEQFSLEYTPDWIATGFPLSPQLNFDHKITSLQISTFLKNLLPENIGLDYLIEHLAVSKNNTFALIKAIGLDTSGAVTFSPPDIPLPTTTLRKVTTEELKKRLQNPDIFPLEVWDNKPRLSVAGVQSKLNLFMFGDVCGFGEGQLSSTHIVKFEKNHHHHLVLNEYICMKLAKLLGFSVAEVSIMNIGTYRA